jgi:RNA polymerase sigma-70 factor (ECF subfamily)
VFCVVDFVATFGTPMQSKQPDEEFEEFFARVRASLIGQAALLTGDREHAQDLAQEALARTWRSWDRVRHYEDPASWTRRVLYNLAVSDLRHRRHRGGATDGGSLPGPSPDAVAVASALQRLPCRMRRVIVLHYYTDMQVAEIARELRVPEGTVKSWLARGRASIASALRDDPPEDR